MFRLGGRWSPGIPSEAHPTAMTANDQCSRGAAATSADEIGKVFVALDQGMRQCLICEGVFTQQAAAEHANIVCTSGMNMKTGSSC